MKTKIDKKVGEIYNTPIGSLVVTFGIINNLTEEEVRSCYNSLKKRKNSLPNTFAQLCKVVWEKIGKDENIPLRANVVLVYDKLNIRSPLVTLLNDEGNLCPLKPNGEYTGILMTAAAGSDLIEVEFLYTETGEEIKDEENE